MFQPFERNLTIAICRNPPPPGTSFSLSPLNIHPSLSALFLQVGPPLLLLPPFAHGHGRDVRAAAPLALPAVRPPGSQPWVYGLPGDPKQLPALLFPLPPQPNDAGSGRPQLQPLGHDGDHVPVTPAPPRRWDQHKEHPHPLRNTLKQEATPRSGRTQGPHSGAMVLRRTASQAAFLPKLQRSKPTHGFRSTTSPQTTGNIAHPGLNSLLRQGSPEGIDGGAQNRATG
jgi:hypothetical protein